MAHETTGCVFCDIVAGRAAADIVGENELSLALVDINPLAEGHCLVIPKRHEPWWHDLTEEETASLFVLARDVARRMMSALGPDFVCLYARGRRIPHTHIFLVPSHAGDPLDRYFNALEAFQEGAPELARLGEPAPRRAVARRLTDG